ALSASLGEEVLSLVVESAGGCAMFSCFQHGRPRRSIENSDDAVTLTGEPLVQEAGIDVRQFYMDEAEAIWKALGLTTFTGGENEGRWQAICVVDRTDYADVLQKMKRK